MTNILIRNVDEAVLARIDAHATATGLSRAEYLRRCIEQDAARAVGGLSLADVDQFAHLSDDLSNEAVMNQAWS